jgi:hypothetical protein
MPSIRMATPDQNRRAKGPPVKANGPVDVCALGRVKFSPKTLVGAVVVVLPGTVVVVHAADVVVVLSHGTDEVVVVSCGTVVVVEPGFVVVVVDGSVVGEQPEWAGLVLPMPLLPSHS